MNVCIQVYYMCIYMIFTDFQCCLYVWACTRSCVLAQAHTFASTHAHVHTHMVTCTYECSKKHIWTFSCTNVHRHIPTITESRVNNSRLSTLQHFCGCVVLLLSSNGQDLDYKQTQLSPTYAKEVKVTHLYYNKKENSHWLSGALTRTVVCVVENSWVVGRDALGKSEPDSTPGGHRELPQGTTQVPEGDQDDARGETPWQQDEGVPRLTAALCWPQTWGSAWQVSFDYTHPFTCICLSV